MTGAIQLNEHYRRGLTYLDQGLYLDAVSEFEQVLRETGLDSPESKLAAFHITEAHSRIAEDSLRCGAMDIAEQHLRTAAKLQPRYPDLHFGIAKILAEKGLVHEAMAELENALEINPRYAKALLLLGVLAYETGEYAAGLEHIEHAVTNEPRYFTPVYIDALAQHQAQQFDNAQFAFRSMLADDVDDVTYHFCAGRNAYTSGKYAQAVECFEQALSVNDRYADIRNWLGLALMGCQRSEEALEHFKAALEINPAFAVAAINAGVACEMLGSRTRAMEFYRHALEIDPHNMEARERLASS
jgi:protein O-GlcNAc transferase